MEWIKDAEAILCEVYECTPDELQLNITLNPDKDKIMLAMAMYKNMFLDELSRDGTTFTYWGGDTDWDAYDMHKDNLPPQPNQP